MTEDYTIPVPEYAQAAIVLVRQKRADGKYRYPLRKRSDMPAFCVVGTATEDPHGFGNEAVCQHLAVGSVQKQIKLDGQEPGQDFVRNNLVLAGSVNSVSKHTGKPVDNSLLYVLDIDPEVEIAIGEKGGIGLQMFTEDEIPDNMMTFQSELLKAFFALPEEDRILTLNDPLTVTWSDWKREMPQDTPVETLCGMEDWPFDQTVINNMAEDKIHFNWVSTADRLFYLYCSNAGATHDETVSMINYFKKGLQPV